MDMYLIVVKAISTALIFIAACFSLACGREEQKVIDPALAPLLEKYLSLAPDEGKLSELVSLEFGETGAANGNCNVTTEDVAGFSKETKRSVTIAPLYNEGYVNTVYHELGHCLHGLPHTDGPFDLMNPHRVGPSHWHWENIDVAISEMFTRD